MAAPARPRDVAVLRFPASPVANPAVRRTWLQRLLRWLRAPSTAAPDDVDLPRHLQRLDAQGRVPPGLLREYGMTRSPGVDPHELWLYGGSRRPGDR